MEMTPKVMAFDGRSGCILGYMGYMAHQEDPPPGFFLLTTVPVTVADASDDLPPATLFVHLPLSQAHRVASHQVGLLVLTGTLRVGHQEESDGRNSMMRRQLEAPSDQWAYVSRQATRYRCGCLTGSSMGIATATPFFVPATVFLRASAHRLAYHLPLFPSSLLDRDNENREDRNHGPAHSLYQRRPVEH